MDKLFRISSALLLMVVGVVLISSGQSSASTFLGNHLNKLGYNEHKVKAALKSSIFRKDGEFGQIRSVSYDPKFRPASKNNYSSSTQVTVSLRDFRIAGFELSTLTLGFTGKILLEYFDSRLAYEAPEGVKYIVVSPKDPFYTPVWKPSIRFYAHLSNRTGFLTHPYPITEQIVVTPEGFVQIQSDFGGIRELRSRKPRRFVNDFTLRISVEETINDVKLIWNRDLPVTFHSAEFEVELPAQAEFGVRSEGTAAFERTEDGGILGENLFSCLLFDFSLARDD